MFKILEFAGCDDNGNPLVQALFPRGDLTKFASPNLNTEIEQYARSIKPDPKYLYVLVNALGAGEFYGSNINGDFFEESQLLGIAADAVGQQLYPDAGTEEWGYQTFSDAGIFRHHRNKNKLVSMGECVFATYNHQMHRVELIIRIDRDAAIRYGHSDLVASLDRGEHPAVSMGARVKYDKCSICGHKSKTKADYCIHMKTMAGRILSDGRKVFVYNPRPRFFDLSFVVIGADRTSYAMMKVAHALRQRYGDPAETDRSVKLAFLKSAFDKKVAAAKLSAVKTSEIQKKINAMSSALAPVMNKDRDMPDVMLDELAKHPTNSVLTTSAANGMVLSPREFQRVILIRLGARPLADRLDNMGATCCSCCGSPVADRSVTVGNPDDYYPLIQKILSAIVPERSGFDAPLINRITVVRRSILPLGREKEAQAFADPERYLTEKERALLTMVSSGYNGYREQLLEKISSIASLITVKEPGVLAALDIPVFGDTFGLAKQATAPSLPLQLLGVLPLAYLYGAHVRKNANAGELPGVLDRFVEKHPNMASGILLGLLRLGEAAKGSGLLDKAVSLLAR